MRDQACFQVATALIAILSAYASQPERSPLLYSPRSPLERKTVHRGRNLAYECEGPLPTPQFITMSGGEAHYETPSGRFVVNDDVYLLLNRDQQRRMRIHSETPVRSFLIFLHIDWIQSADRFLDLTDEALLDSPDGVGNLTEFFERTYPRNDRVGVAFEGIRTAIEANVFTDGWLEERVRLLIQGLVAMELETRERIDRIRAVRRSTREELFRRLCRARSYVEGNLSTPLHLSDISSAASMSPHHFLRSFHCAFGETPHTYVTRLRIERAQALLVSSDQSVKSICYEVGFESPASFSSLFRRKTGQSPTRFRQFAN